MDGPDHPGALQKKHNNPKNKITGYAASTYCPALEDAGSGGRGGGDGPGLGLGSGSDSDSDDSNRWHGNENTEAYYKKMIETYPGNALLLANYARFLKEVL